MLTEALESRRSLVRQLFTAPCTTATFFVSSEQWSFHHPYRSPGSSWNSCGSSRSTSGVHGSRWGYSKRDWSERKAPSSDFTVMHCCLCCFWHLNPGPTYTRTHNSGVFFSPERSGSPSSGLMGLTAAVPRNSPLQSEVASGSKVVGPSVLLVERES
jgi:hypothetical protein